jgi:hypothetical protein
MRDWKAWTSLVLGLVALATLVIGGISVWFNDQPPVFPYSAKVLISTFAAGMTVLAIGAMTLTYRDRNRLAWYSLWAYPAFFVAHVIMLGTYVPDLVLAVVAAAALALGWPGTTSSASGGQSGSRSTWPSV